MAFCARDALYPPTHRFYFIPGLCLCGWEKHRGELEISRGETAGSQDLLDSGGDGCERGERGERGEQGRGERQEGDSCDGNKLGGSIPPEDALGGDRTQIGNPGPSHVVGRVVRGSYSRKERHLDHGPAWYWKNDGGSSSRQRTRLCGHGMRATLALSPRFGGLLRSGCGACAGK